MFTLIRMKLILFALPLMGPVLVVFAKPGLVIDVVLLIVAIAGNKRAFHQQLDSPFQNTPG